MFRQREEFESKLLDLARVTRVTAGGKHLRFRAAIILGDRKGKVGLGVAKGRDVQQAIQKATTRAKKSFISVPIREETIPTDIEIKYHSAKIFLRPQKKGRGIVAGGVIRALCDLGGIPNITGKLITKTNNKINIARATLKAFEELKDFMPREESVGKKPIQKKSV
ncbi:MAG: 30S ribosomal protein S5 [Patescibacteria group bacterium]